MYVKPSTVLFLLELEHCVENVLGEVKSSERFFALFASGKRSELFTSPNIFQVVRRIYML